MKSLPKKESENESAFLPEYLSDKYLDRFISNELKEKLGSAFSKLLTTHQKSATNAKERKGKEIPLHA